MKIDVNKEKWLSELAPISNGTLSGWLHYIKLTRKKLVPDIKDYDERIRWERFLSSVADEVEKSMTRPKPKPKIVDFGKGS